MTPLPYIEPGARALVAGRSGSGKSTWACWMLTRSPGHWVILNPKHTSAYKNLPDSVVIDKLDFKSVERAMEKRRFVVVNPGTRDANSDSMDAFILELHENWRGVGLCCDELYTLHKGAVAGEGLLGWLTRGRELKQSFLGLTQRPAWLSQFLFSESSYICGMSLTLVKDRKRMYEMTDRKEFLAKLPEREWLWYVTATEKMAHYGAVPAEY